MNDTWTIGELVDRAADVLRPDAQRSNGRVRDVPNERLIRWYTTIGLLDPPLTRRGRVALYGRRHLLQLIAIKRCQADGRSIADIQTALTGATDTTLEAIARLPAPDGRTPDGIRDSSPGGAATGEVTGGSPCPPPARPRFWAERPLVPPPAGPPGAARASTGPPPTGQPVTRKPLAGQPGAGAYPIPHAPEFVHGVRLAPGVTLLLDGRALTPDDLPVLRQAAAPLLAALRDRDLAGPDGPPTTPADHDGSSSEGMRP